MEKSAPAGTTRSTLTPENRAWAWARARRAGRRYPNLVDNLAAARRQQEQEPAAGEHTKAARRTAPDRPR